MLSFHNVLSFVVDCDYRRPPPEDRELLPDDLPDDEFDLLEEEDRPPIFELRLEELLELLLDARDPDELLFEEPELHPLLLLRDPDEFLLFQELLLLLFKPELFHSLPLLPWLLEGEVDPPLEELFEPAEGRCPPLFRLLTLCCAEGLLGGRLET